MRISLDEAILIIYSYILKGLLQKTPRLEPWCCIFYQSRVDFFKDKLYIPGILVTIV